MSTDKFVNLLTTISMNISLSKQEGLSDKEAFLKEADNLSIALCTVLDRELEEKRQAILSKLTAEEIEILGLKK